MLRTTDLLPGDQIRLIDFADTAPLYRQKLLSLGLTKGSIAKVVRFAPLGCPIQIDIRGAQFAIRKEEACHLLWERV